MSGREDTGSHDVAGAEWFERRRAREHGPDDDDTPMRFNGRRAPSGCRCHSRSEEPCEWCSRTEDDSEAEERECRRIEAALRDVEVLSDRDVNPENVMRLLRDATGHSTGTCPGHERGDA